MPFVYFSRDALQALKAILSQHEQVDWVAYDEAKATICNASLDDESQQRVGDEIGPPPAATRP